jgi:hypothetical protein
MKMQYRPVRLFACAALLSVANPLPGFAQQMACLGQVQAALRPDVWGAITNYFASLSLTNSSDNRSRLIRLRAQIVMYEVAKQRLIEIVGAHIRGNSAGSAVSNELRLSTIPVVLDQMNVIIAGLVQLAKEGNLFAAERSFKDLMINFDLKRGDTLCRLALETAAPSPNLLAMAALEQELKDELQAISTADEALAKYIKESNK